ncbi:hypothetical protein AB1L30_01095 [Bremerella sp. JC817]|uniref:hypothetical protein n=1 Tax=Bremerella sp. JC817 TaxID=3231756 RepID=UPI00345AE8F3
MRLLILLISIVMCGGCHSQPAIPRLPPINTIKATVNAVPELDILAISSVEVPEDQLASFARLVTPIKPCSQSIDPTIHYHVADLTVEHRDGTSTTLLVRFTGHNPAAISLDHGESYYYGGTDEFPAEAIRIIRLLHQYDYDSRN